MNEGTDSTPAVRTAPVAPPFLDLSSFASPAEIAKAVELTNWLHQLRREVFDNSPSLAEAKELLRTLDVRLHDSELTEDYDFGFDPSKHPEAVKQGSVADGVYDILSMFTGFSGLFDAFEDLADALAPDAILRDLIAERHRRYLEKQQKAAPETVHVTD
ncbi:hypothetical protein [Dermatobacter hominis]|uniref:hypothetical protein n=1 Tax=Dermatobacter hominis TaxID=2884263 RepID=UPI001D109211|nr:hypothetical protein [Dermatobacter hominis]UDY35530.1 hypothetical protein LH044_19640 [Dermatobacter hominis]